MLESHHYNFSSKDEGMTKYRDTRIPSSEVSGCQIIFEDPLSCSVRIAPVLSLTIRLLAMIMI